MSEEQHAWDDANLVHVKASGVDGGHCLNRHEGRAKNNSCSHQWQGFKKAEDFHTDYDWPLYENIAGHQMPFFVKAEKGESSVEWRTVGKPEEGDWDVGKNYPRKINGETRVNHQDHCNTPYYHEAHHVIPNSTLRLTIVEMFPDEPVTRSIRGGLLDEGYNLNHKSNMILLPLGEKVANALRLPRHRELAMRSHPTYNDNVATQVKKVLKVNQKNVADCKLVKYSKMKRDLTNLSEKLFDRIKNAGKAAVGSLDMMSPNRFV